MAGAFSKGGGGTPLTPAQMALQQNALDESRHFGNVWMPVQSFFAQKTMGDAPGLEEMGRGRTAATARSLGSEGTLAGLADDSSHGSGAGSSRFLRDLGGGSNATAAATGKGLVDATAAGRRHYAMGLQDILGIGQHDQSTAMQGLRTASNAEAQEAGAVAQSNAASEQSSGAALGTLLTAIA